MANFFDTERYKCDCGCELFEIIPLYMFNKDNNKRSATPELYHKAIKCISCGKIDIDHDDVLKEK